MRPMNMKNAISKTQLILTLMAAVTLLFTPAAFAAAPGITGTTFNLTAQPAYLNQPDGEAVYSWGYGCANTTGISYLPAMPNATPSCNSMQVPGPTLIFQAPASGTTTVTINLTNGLPAAAGNTSILFPGFSVTTSGGVAGLLTQAAAPVGCVTIGCNTVTYTLTIPSTAAGTRAYYS